MKTLSIRAPWWWMILHAGKDIENRDWATHYRGPVYIHASKWFNRADIADDFALMKHAMPKDIALPSMEDIRALGGHVVGVVDITGCVTESESPWFFGRYGFALQCAREIKPFPIKGQLGFFEVTT